MISWAAVSRTEVGVVEKRNCVSPSIARPVESTMLVDRVKTKVDPASRGAFGRMVALVLARFKLTEAATLCPLVLASVNAPPNTATGFKGRENSTCTEVTDGTSTALFVGEIAVT